MNSKQHHERVTAEVKQDGVHVKHQNGAFVVIPLSIFLKWCLRQLKERT